MKIRLYHARILTMVNNFELETGEVHILDNHISYIGKPKDEKEDWDQEIDCGNNLILPGFKNAHTHSAMTFLRSYADDLPLNEWLYQRVFPMEAKLTEEGKEAFIKLAILEYLSSGITANFDMYLNNRAHGKVSEQMGFRTVLCGAMNDFVSSVSEEAMNYKKYNQKSDLISYKLGFHAEYTTGRERLEELAALAKEVKAPVYMHVSETKKEVNDCIERYGKTPLSFLDSIGMFEYGGGGFHGVWLTEKEMDLCKEKNISIITNPASNLKLASGIADLCKMEEKGITLAIGTDGPASNNALDMFREMYLAAVLPKQFTHDAAAMQAEHVLYMACVGGAKAMGLYDCDCLAKGKKADLIVLDLNQPNMQPEHNLVKNIVYSASKENVILTMVDGKILYEKGSFHLNETASDIYESVKEHLEKMKA